MDKVQQRLDRMRHAMTVRKSIIEHVFGTLKHWMGWTHFLTRGSPEADAQNGRSSTTGVGGCCRSGIGSRMTQISLKATFRSFHPLSRLTRWMTPGPAERPTIISRLG